MNKIISLVVITLLLPMYSFSQGWEENYKGVMLQGFYWDSFNDTQWANLESQAKEIGDYFSLIWVPQSGNCGNGLSMGYNDVYWFNHNSSFGNEAQLRSMINAFKNNNVGVIEDVVINHRNGVSSWTDFPSETYKGKTYKLTDSDICRTDECVAAGYEATGANDTGDDFNGLRDLDHTSTNVQNNVEVYLDFLLNDLGYSGFRYDLVKGFAPKYIEKYNSQAKPKFSVGEYWDGSYDKVVSWIEGTKNSEGVIQSAAFDFPNKYCLNQACNDGKWDKLMWKRNGTLSQPAGLIHMDKYQRYAVTFVDNHDSYRDHNKVANNVMAANAFILTMPGTPCVFLPHWKMYKEHIKKLILARKMAGITNQSAVEVLKSNSNIFAAKVTGNNCDLYMKVGPENVSPSVDCTKIAEGTNYTVWIDNSIHSLWVDKPSGTYTEGSDITFIPLTKSSNYKIYYTTDKSTPSVNNGKLLPASGVVKLNKNMTFKAVLVDEYGKSEVFSAEYKIKEAFTPYKATIYVRADWSKIYYYVWDDNGALMGNWPGTVVADKKTIKGQQWYYHSFDINADNYSVNAVFNKGSNQNQTVDITGIKNDRYYVISEDKPNGKFTVEDVTSTIITSIPKINKDAEINVFGGYGSINVSLKQEKVINVFSTSGILVKSIKLPVGRSVIYNVYPGIYIVEKQKVLVR